MVKNASNRQYRKKNTDIDWSKHEMTIRQEGSITIHHLKFPDSSIYNVKFINGEGVLTVTGDFGNWVFCSPFVPSETGYVSEAYWLEKLRIASCQNPYEYSPDETMLRIKEKIAEVEAQWEGKNKSGMIDYLKNLIDYADDEYEYIYHMRATAPSFIDCEDYIIGKKIHGWLEFVFDAFNECCNRIEDLKNTQL